jgi:hypothetical protein
MITLFRFDHIGLTIKGKKEMGVPRRQPNREWQLRDRRELLCLRSCLVRRGHRSFATFKLTQVPGGTKETYLRVIPETCSNDELDLLTFR